ncbi:FMN-binding protein [Pseudonocardia abyssalis]|uniref:FMN-binding protein n=2 Tax=Pseudonocardia abyssalis TaxID=2792008 RepID=A0ABS6V0D4_9PSEU|nr:FMN-binding protein [Pseudonocardia abyssalis]MBW0137696.1 FMN-binding protein [Pseudonocardia abyssalis]
MRRVSAWFLSTIAIVTLLFGYRTSTSGPDLAVAVAAAPSTTSPSPTSPSPASPSATSSGTVTGSVAQTRWGPVQVQLTVADGVITAVDVVQYPQGNDKDQRINARALPVLVQETLGAQSADVDMVSGATVTSEGYLESLQSAIDQAGLA